ncbi:hypothetical protein C9925_01575 [cyanobacterium G8-9]|nr:hypothetical protein C9925_01575 [cyanobacterium G8-9]
MKQYLGKILLLLFCFTYLSASDFDYSIHVDNTTPYVKEAVILTVDVNQTNHDIVLLFDFDLVKSDAYTFQRIDIKEIDAYHAVQIRYTYLIYPLKSGVVDINFHLVQKATTDASVAYSFSGDRDNVKGLVTTNSKIDLAPLILQVKEIPKETQIVGDFTLTYKVKTHEAKAYEPLPLQVTIKGLGYPPLIDPLITQEGNFTLFTEAPLVTSIATHKGTHTTVTYPMAFSHNKSFTLHPIVIHAFNPKTEKYYTLDVPTQHFTITQIDKKTLIDTIDAPAPFTTDWRWVQTLLGYFLVFFAGYLTALSLKWGKKKKHQTDNPLIGKIQNAKT